MFKKKVISLFSSKEHPIACCLPSWLSWILSSTFSVFSLLLQGLWLFVLNVKSYGSHRGTFSMDSSPPAPRAVWAQMPRLAMMLASTWRSSTNPGTWPTHMHLLQKRCVCVCECVRCREEGSVGVCECVLVDINGLNVLHALCALCLFRRALVTSPTHPNLA